MKLFRLIKLGNADFKARRKIVINTTIAASIPFVILFTINLTLNGIENVLLRESGRVTNDEVILTVSGARPRENIGENEENNTLTSLVKQYGGEIISEIEAEYAARYAKPMTYLANLAQIDLSKITLRPNEGIIDPSLENFHLVDLMLDGIRYAPPSYNTADLVENLAEQQMFLVKFPSVSKAYEYIKYIQDNYLKIGVNEPFSNLLNIYTNFRSIDRQLVILQVIFVIVAIIIVISSYVYLLDQNMHSMVVYRALGASTWDLLMISLTYLLEVGLCIVICSLVLSSIFALIFSWASASYLTDTLTNFYNYRPTSVLLLGWSLDMLIVRLTILVAAPISLLLMLDQFSTQSLTKKLKREEP